MFILVIIVLLTLVSSIVLFGQNGKREFLKLDLVQFIYAFLLAPVMFVCMKTFLFYFWKQASIPMTVNQLFIADTTLSVFLMFIYAFIVLHSLTKTFSLKIREDPLHDLFAHSEFFHLMSSHVAVYAGTMIVVGFFVTMNLLIPLPLSFTHDGMYLLMGLAFVTGAIIFKAVVTVEINGFVRLMKLLWGFFFLAHAVAQFVLEIPFSGQFIVFWFSFVASLGVVALSLFWQPQRARSLLQKIRRRVAVVPVRVRLRRR